MCGTCQPAGANCAMTSVSLCLAFEECGSHIVTPALFFYCCDSHGRSKDLLVTFNYSNRHVSESGWKQATIAAIPSIRFEPGKSSMTFHIYSKSVGTVILGIETAGNNIIKGR